MVQFLSIHFFSWISSIFVGFFKSSRFFCVTLYFRRFHHSCRRQCDVPGLSNTPQLGTVPGPGEFRPGPFPARYHTKEEPVQLFGILCWAEELCGYVGSTTPSIPYDQATEQTVTPSECHDVFLIIQGVQMMIV